MSKDGWKKFGSKLNTILDSTLIHILALDFKKQAFSFSYTVGVASQDELANIEVQYLRYPIEDDPRWPVFLDTKREGWYQCHHTVTDKFVDHSALYQELLLPTNIRYTSAKELILDESLCVLLAVHTSPMRDVLTRDELDFLDKLMVHLKRIVLIQRNIFEYSSKAIMGYALIDKLSQPIILLNLSGEVLHLNKAAKNILDQNNNIVIRKNNIFIPEPYCSQLYDRLLEVEVMIKKGINTSEQIFNEGNIKIVNQNGGLFYLFCTLLISDQELKAFGIRPTVMMTIYDPTSMNTIDAQLLYVAFRLTPAEAKVALLLLEGYLPKEIAQKHKINLDTVRKQLQSIYKKTSTNRQADLVKLLLNLPRFIQEY